MWDRWYQKGAGISHLKSLESSQAKAAAVASESRSVPRLVPAVAWMGRPYSWNSCAIYDQSISRAANSIDSIKPASRSMRDVSPRREAVRHFYYWTVTAWLGSLGLLPSPVVVHSNHLNGTILKRYLVSFCYRDFALSLSLSLSLQTLPIDEYHCIYCSSTSLYQIMYY